MGQVSRHLRRAISLRSDPGRLSLETLLTGTALGLALLYLMQEGAAAAGLNQGQQSGAGSDGPGGDGPGSSDSSSGGGSDSGSGGGHGGSGHGGGETGGEAAAAGPGMGAAAADSRQAIAGSEPPAGASAAGAGGTGAGRAAGSGSIPASGPGLWSPVEAPPAGAGASMGRFPDQPGPGSPLLGTAALPWTGGPGASPGGSAGGSPDPTPGGELTMAGLSGQPWAQELLEPAPEPRIPGLRVVLRSREGIVSRSVAGPARSDYRQTLGAISGARLDLRDVASPQVLVSSSQELQLLALSRLQDADLLLTTDHTGLQQASLLFGPEANDIRLQVSAAIDLGLVAAGTARGQIHQSLIAMLDSQLQDSGGATALDLSSLVRFLLKVPGEPLERHLKIDLLAQAMQNSTIRLGDGNDVVTIASGFQNLEAPGPGLLIDIATAPGADNDPSLQLRARALGLVNSSLETGAGNDQVSIATWLDQGDAAITAPIPTAPRAASSNRQRIALIDSTLLLGDGDDQLRIDGAVIASRIDPGSGDNQLEIDGEVQDLQLRLGRDSRNRISLLGAADDRLTISLAPGDRAELQLQSGAGDDQIQLPLGQLAGRVDGGGGANTLADNSPAPAPDAAMTDPGAGEAGEPLQVRLDSPGAGTVGSLAFTRIDQLRFGPLDVTVSIAARGELSGTIRASAGQGSLDYSDWQTPVQADLSRGQASGILGGLSGFNQLLGGSGDDQLTAAGDSRRLDGGPGDDTIRLNLAPGQYGPGVQLFGGEGRDTFVLSGLAAIQAAGTADERLLPALADLKLESSNSGGIGLSDTLQWRQEGILTGAVGQAGAEEGTITLTPSGLEGLGQARLLPIAPLEQLLAGIHAGALNGPQLVIAAGTTHSSLVLVGSDGSPSWVADLPTLRLASSLPQNSATGAGPGGLVA